MSAQRLPLPQPEAAVENITPAQATAYLEGNIRNRHIRQSTVEQYARDMAAGNWRMTGEAIKFANDGMLLDGQHRLWAIVESGATVQILVVRGVLNEAQDVMDSGMKRQASDALTLSGYRNTVLLASVARLGIALDNGMGVRATGLGREQPTHTEIMEWIEANPTVEEAAAIAQSRFSKVIDAPPTATAYAYWILNAKNPEECRRFFEGMATLSTRGEGDPRYAAMRLFMKAKTDRTRLSHTVALSVYFRAWNAWRQGKQVRFFRTQADGALIPIPEPRT